MALCGLSCLLSPVLVSKTTLFLPESLPNLLWWLLVTDHHTEEYIVCGFRTEGLGESSSLEGDNLHLWKAKTHVGVVASV